MTLFRRWRGLHRSLHLQQRGVSRAIRLGWRP